MSQFVDPANLIFQFLEHVSGPAGADDQEMTTDYAAAVPSVYEYECPAGYVAYLARLNIMIRDAGPSAGEFGGIAALAEGCQVQLIDDDGATVLLDFTDAHPILMNAHFTLLAGSDLGLLTGAGADLVSVRWTLEKATGGRLVRLTPGQRFRWTNNDNLTGLDEFRCMLQGYLAAT